MVSFVLFHFSFSVTLLGTNARHSAVTRGKPSLFLVPFFSLPGLFELAFCFFGTSFSTSLVCPSWFFRVV